MKKYLINSVILKSRNCGYPHCMGFGRAAVRAGFTLIELLVVVLIIGILAAVALPQYRVAVQRARYVQLVAAVDAVVQAQERYYMANGVYTPDMSNLDVTIEHKKYKLSLDVRPNGHGAVQGDTPDVGYVRYFARSAFLPGQRQCRVYPADAPAYLHQVCKGASGREHGVALSAYTTYIF